MGALKFVKAVYGGVREYGQQSRAANMEAEHKLSGTFGGSSTEADATRVAVEAQRIKKERNQSMMNSIRKHLMLQ